MMIYCIATAKVVRGSREQRQPFIKPRRFFSAGPQADCLVGRLLKRTITPSSANDRIALIHGPLTVYRQVYKVFFQYHHLRVNRLPD